VFFITLSGYEPSLISEPIDGMKIRPLSTKNGVRAFRLCAVLSRRHEKASSFNKHRVFTPSGDLPSLIAELVDSMKIQPCSTPKLFTSSGYVLSLITEPVDGIKKATTFNRNLVF